MSMPVDVAPAELPEVSNASKLGCSLLNTNSFSSNSGAKPPSRPGGLTVAATLFTFPPCPPCPACPSTSPFLCLRDLPMSLPPFLLLPFPFSFDQPPLGALYHPLPQPRLGRQASTVSTLRLALACLRASNSIAADVACWYISPGSTCCPAALGALQGSGQRKGPLRGLWTLIELCRSPDSSGRGLAWLLDAARTAGEHEG